MPGLYIHIPFCLAKCAYCDFYSVPVEGELSGEFIKSLLREMELRGWFHADTIYIGGGTPTALDSGSLEKIFSGLKEHFGFSSDAEFTIEANPATVDGGKLSVLLQGGVNRISIGVQSFDDEELKTLGRVHTAADAREAIALARRAGFGNISLDLIYGIPGQTMESWMNTLNQAISLAPEHISAYELTLEECTPLHEWVKRGLIEMPSEEMILEMSDKCVSVLESAGYARYEVSNYALPGRQCRHNVNYWRRGPYLGLGPSAHSFDGRERWKDIEDLGEYVKSLSAGALPERERYALMPGQVKREFLFLGLRMSEGVSIEEARETGLGLENASRELMAGGFLAIENGHLRCTRRGFSVLNRVLLALFDNLGL